MKKESNRRKIKTFVYKGLGIPIKLLNTPMKKAAGEWCIDINMNKLMQLVLEIVIQKTTALKLDELRYIRTYLEMTRAEFGKTFGVSSTAVLDWENGKNRISPALELCIRLYVLNYLHAKDQEFRALYNNLSLQQLAKSPKRSLLVIDAIAEKLQKS